MNIAKQLIPSFELVANRVRITAEQLIDRYLASEGDSSAILYHYYHQRPGLHEQDDYDDDDLGEGAPKDPYERAVYRIQSLFTRFGGDMNKVEQHTVLRARKTHSVAKLNGLIKAAKKFKLKKAVEAAKKQLAIVS